MTETLKQTFMASILFFQEGRIGSLGATALPFHARAWETRQCEICRNSWQFGPTYASRARRHIILHRPFPSRDGCSGPQ